MGERYEVRENESEYYKKIYPWIVVDTEPKEARTVVLACKQHTARQLCRQLNYNGFIEVD